MAFRETPFGDRGDRYLTYAGVAFGVFLLVLLYGTVTGTENVLQGWLNVGTAAALVGGTVAVYGWRRQRRLVGRLDDVAPGPRGDRTVVEGRIAEETGTVEAPVVDDDRVDGGGEATALSGWAATDPTTPGPDEEAVTRWYEARVVEYVRKVLGRGHKSETVHRERRGATPFLVESRTETVDLTGADLSFPQGERERFESPTVGVEGGDLDLAGWSETLAPEAEIDAETDTPTRTDADSPTAALVGRAAADGDRLLREESYRVTGRRWAAADGEAVYVVGALERGRDGRLRPEGPVTVGRGRFEDRLDEERERLERWTQWGRYGAVVLAVGVATTAVRVVGV